MRVTFPIQSGGSNNITLMLEKRVSKEERHDRGQNNKLPHNSKLQSNLHKFKMGLELDSSLQSYNVSITFFLLWFIKHKTNKFNR